jgi:hypothetical protein
VTGVTTPEIRLTFVLAHLEKNTALETFEIDSRSGNVTEIKPKVYRLLSLNRSGRRLLAVTGERTPFPLAVHPG